MRSSCAGLFESGRLIVRTHLECGGFSPHFIASWLHVSHANSVRFKVRDSKIANTGLSPYPTGRDLLVSNSVNVEDTPLYNLNTKTMIVP